MSEFSGKLGAKKKKIGAKKAAEELGISLASFYNYWNKTDLPGYEVLKRSHDLWEWTFEHIDFGQRPSAGRAPSEVEQPRQYMLPFIRNVHENDIEVTRAKAVKPDCLELTVKIKFAG